MITLPHVRNLFAAAFLSAAVAAQAQNYTIKLVDNTNLPSGQYEVFIAGYSTASELMVNAAGELVSASSGTTIQSFPLSSLSEITIPAATEFRGGIFFVIVLPGDPSTLTAPSFAFGANPATAPNNPYAYGIFEMTNIPGNPATVDTSVVDGLLVPLSFSAFTTADPTTASSLGQPIYATGETAIVNRQSILDQYPTFMSAQPGGKGTPYQDLIFAPNSVLGQAGGILNPNYYVGSNGGFGNPLSPLVKVWDAPLAELFNASTNFNVQGVQSGSIPTDTYTVSFVTGQQYTTANSDGSYATLSALRFQSDTDANRTFYIFNPLEANYFYDDNGAPLTGNSAGNTVVLSGPVSAMQPGMYLYTVGISGFPIKITSVNSQTVTLESTPTTIPPDGAPFAVSRFTNTSLIQNNAQMVFGNQGVFSDNVIQYPSSGDSQNVLGNLENQVVTALNRGVALVQPATPPASGSGATSAMWGDQRNWYLNDEVSNLYSFFMHAAEVTSSGTSYPIYIRPPGAENWQNLDGVTFAAAYGFGFDENAGPVPPAPANQPDVPSKFDGTVVINSEVTLIVAPWVASASLTPTTTGIPTTTSVVIPTPAPVPAATPNSELVIVQAEIVRIEDRMQSVRLRGGNPQIRANELKRLRARLSQLRLEELYLDPSYPLQSGIDALNAQIRAVRQTITNPSTRNARIRSLEAQRDRLIQIQSTRE